MPASWIVNVAGRAYGPYTDAQMQAFASEGRLAPQSLVARNGETQFRAAADEPALAALFGLHKLSAAEPAKHRALADPGSGGDVVHGDRVCAALGDQPARGV